MQVSGLCQLLGFLSPTPAALSQVQRETPAPCFELQGTRPWLMLLASRRPLLHTRGMELRVVLRVLRAARLSVAWGAGQGPTAELLAGAVASPPSPGARAGTGGFQRVASPGHLGPAGPLSLRASSSGLVLPAWWPRPADLPWVSSVPLHAGGQLCLCDGDGESQAVLTG